MRPPAATRPAPRSPSASPVTPSLRGRFRESLGLPDQTPPRSPGLSRPLPPSPPASLRSPSAPAEPLSLPGRSPEATRGSGRLGWEDGRGAGSTRAGPGRLEALRGRVVPEGVRAVGGCGEGARGGGEGSEGRAKGRTRWRPGIRGSAGPVEGREGARTPRMGRGLRAKPGRREAQGHVSQGCRAQVTGPWRSPLGPWGRAPRIGVDRVRPELALLVGRGS